MPECFAVSFEEKHSRSEQHNVFLKGRSDIEILDLIFRLPPKYRDSIYLYYFEELSVQEIAQLTKIKENTIKNAFETWKRTTEGYDNVVNYINVNKKLGHWDVAFL